jgi:predicted nucleic acid-binding protein
MILVDSSVWIDFFRNAPTPEAEWLDRDPGAGGQPASAASPPQRQRRLRESRL